MKAGQLLAVIGPVGAGKVSNWIASTQSAMAVLSGHKMEGSVTGQPVPSQPWWFCQGTRWKGRSLDNQYPVNHGGFVRAQDGRVSHWTTSTQSLMVVLSRHKMEGSVTGQPAPSQPWWFCHGTRWQSQSLDSQYPVNHSGFVRAKDVRVSHWIASTQSTLLILSGQKMER